MAGRASDDGGVRMSKRQVSRSDGKAHRLGNSFMAA